MKVNKSLLVGKRYGMLTVVKHGGMSEYSPCGKRKSLWICKCDCGNTKILAGNRFHGKSPLKSCGCLNRRHNLCKSSEYYTWASMIQRCTNPKLQSFKDYGGRGITVCERWMDFRNFYEDMGAKPSPKYTIERKDNNKGYYAANCVWILGELQSRNTRQVRWVTAHGKTQCISDWAKETGLSYITIANRLLRGASSEDAVSPIRRQGIRIKAIK